MLPGFCTGMLLGSAAGGPAGDAWFAEDGATWPIYGTATWPSATYDSGGDRTWIVWEGWNQDSRTTEITSYGHAAGTWSDVYVAGVVPLSDDDHGVPSLCIDGDGYLHVFYGGHNTDLRISSSRSPNDASAWRRDTLAGTYTYPKPSVVGSAIYLFLRKFIFPSSYTLVLRKTGAIVNGEPAWGAEQSIVHFGASSRFYGGVNIIDGTDIHIVATKSPGSDTERKHVYHFIYDTTTGNVSNAEGDTTIASGDLPVDLTEADADFRVVEQSTTEGNTPAFCIDSAGDYHIVYIDGDGTDWDVKHVTFTSGSWSSPETVVSLTSESRFLALILVALSGGAIELYHTEDSAGSWARGGNMIRRERSGAGSWGSPTTILNADPYALDEPSAVRDGHTNLRAIFPEISNDSAAEAGDLKLRGYGAGGFVTRATQGTVPTFPALLLDMSDRGEGTDASFSSVVLLLDHSIGA